jgi:poly-gamma-glutamate synthesis protein (capsule biosynthesis protein)
LLGSAPAASLADEAEPQPTVRLMAVGDTFLGFGIGRRIVNDGPHVPFAKVAETFAGADIVIANLECALSRNGQPWPRKLLHFGAPRKAAEALAVGGIDAVTLANNHTLDYSRPAFLETLDALDQNGVAHAGGGIDAASARAPLIIERNGLRVALLSYVTAFWGPDRFNTRAWEAGPELSGIAIARVGAITADVTAARTAADVVVVAIHGDGEFRRLPNHRQRRMSAAAIDAGAALVIGHGAHVLHGYRSGDHTLIAYGLGNFTFPGYPAVANDTAILDVTLSQAGVESFAFIPVVINRRSGLPRLAAGAEIERIIGRLKPI